MGSDKVDVPNKMGKAKSKLILVLMESLSGSGHTFAASRLRLGDKLELFRLDPWVQQFVIYREKKKIKSIKDKS